MTIRTHSPRTASPIRALARMAAGWLALIATASLADPAPTAPLPPPKLLVAIAVDQYSADLFAQYRQHYIGGLARMMRGAVYPSAFQSHSATETCPGHSTLLTGVHPARTGIIANNWYDLSAKRADKRIYCAEDDTNPDSDSKNPVVSAIHLRVPTLGERMKARWPASRNVAVSAKDRAVMMMGGHAIDAAYWWGGQGFVTYLSKPLVPEALAENARILAVLNKGAPALAAPVWCLPRDRTLQAGPVALGSGRFALDAQNPDGFRISPRMDEATLDLAARLVTDLKLGKGPAPDMLSISLSATDYVGHAYGTEGMEMCIQQHDMDQALAVFFARLDALGIDYAVVLTADHGGLDVPERLDQQGLPSATRADIALTAPALSTAIAGKLGLPAAPQLVYAESPFGDYWVSRDLPPGTRAKVIDTLVSMLRAHPQVERVFTHDELAAAPMPTNSPQDWSMRDRARASFDAERSGDVFSMLKRAVVPIPVANVGYTATHGSPWDYDRRVPLLFWRRGLAGFEQPAPVETVDIAPTLASLIGLATPAGAFDGRCLDIDGGPADTCRGR